jgi:hypothetical protein
MLRECGLDEARFDSKRMIWKSKEEKSHGVRLGVFTTLYSEPSSSSSPLSPLETIVDQHEAANTAGGEREFSLVITGTTLVGESLAGVFLIILTATWRWSALDVSFMERLVA